MLAQLLKRWYAVRDSYWFLPSLMALSAALVALLLGALDRRLGEAWIEQASWINASNPEGARAMLSTIAGSMITVAGVTFSITIAAVAYTTSQFGPRLLANFMQDTGNQVTLGTFIATFVYCMVLLRAVRTAGEGFVPQLGLIGALLLSLASIAVLIYFIHHVTESINISNVVADIGRSLESALSQPAPDNGHNQPLAGHRLGGAHACVCAASNGYIQHLLQSSLVEIARDADLLLQLERQPGDFVHRGETLAKVWPAARCDEAILEKLAQSYALGSTRSLDQDAMFLVDELIEIAARALSPGINDPFTAMSCLDWLRAALVRFGNAPAQPAARYDDDGTLRLLLLPLDFATLATGVFMRLRPYFCADPNAACHIIECLNKIAPAVDRRHHELLAEQNQALYDAAMAMLASAPDKARVRQVYERCNAALT